MKHDFQDLLSEFKAMANGPEERVRLDHGSLLIARSEYPDLDHAKYLAEFVRLAGQVRGRISEPEDSLKTLETFNNVLIEAEGYRGNETDYYDPRNSYLNEVMDRKLGIPISLSLIYLEVARRLDFPLTGVSFPGHFLVRHRSQGRELYLDPFHRGEFLLASDLPGRLCQLFGKEVAGEILNDNQERLPPSFLADATPRDVLSRLLTNLREIYLRRRDLPRARRIVAFLLALGPGNPEARDSIAAIRKIEAALN